MGATRVALRVLIVDDERLARVNLTALLNDLPDVEIVGEATNANEALTLIRSLRPDLVLLDIEMPGITGVELLRRMSPDEIPAVAFVTAYPAYAVEAFEVSALDYVLKPVEAGRLREVVLKAKARQEAHELESYRDRILAFLEPRDQEGPEQMWLTRLVIRSGRKRYVLSMDAVQTIEASGNYVRLSDESGDHLHRISLSEMERRLDPRRFVRVHRSMIVNARRVTEVRTLDRGRYSIVLEGGRTVRVARRNREALERVLRLIRP